MNKYQITFFGRKLGAIGKFYSITTTRTATSKWQAIQALYNEYDLYMTPPLNKVQLIKQGEKMKYKVTFFGRQLGAIGITYAITDIVNLPRGASFEQIRLELYEDYEHITRLKLVNPEQRMLDKYNKIKIINRK
jgi:hypothetical protein